MNTVVILISSAFVVHQYENESVFGHDSTLHTFDLIPVNNNIHKFTTNSVYLDVDSSCRGAHCLTDG